MDQGHRRMPTPRWRLARGSAALDRVRPGASAASPQPQHATHGRLRGTALYGDGPSWALRLVLHARTWITSAQSLAPCAQFLDVAIRISISMAIVRIRCQHPSQVGFSSFSHEARGCEDTRQISRSSSANRPQSGLSEGPRRVGRGSGHDVRFYGSPSQKRTGGNPPVADLSPCGFKCPHGRRSGPSKRQPLHQHVMAH